MQRYSSAGMAHSAAEAITASTGVHHEMAFRPGAHPDFTPFIVVPVGRPTP